MILGPEVTLYYFREGDCFRRGVFGVRVLTCRIEDKGIRAGTEIWELKDLLNQVVTSRVPSKIMSVSGGHEPPVTTSSGPLPDSSWLRGSRRRGLGLCKDQGDVSSSFGFRRLSGVWSEEGRDGTRWLQK